VNLPHVYDSLPLIDDAYRDAEDNDTRAKAFALAPVDEQRAALP